LFAKGATAGVSSSFTRAAEATFAKGLAATAVAAGGEGDPMLAQGLVAMGAMAGRCHGGVAAPTGVSARFALAVRAGLPASEDEGRLHARTCMQTTNN